MQPNLLIDREKIIGYTDTHTPKRNRTDRTELGQMYTNGKAMRQHNPMIDIVKRASHNMCETLASTERNHMHALARL
jgi:hypothetical protein